MISNHLLKQGLCSGFTFAVFVFGFTVITLSANFAEAKSQRRGKNRQLQESVISKKSSSWLLSYDDLISMPEEKRIKYVQGVREALTEFERLNRVSTNRAEIREYSRLYAQLESLYRLLLPTEAHAELPSLGIFKYDRNPKPKEQIRVWCYDQNGQSTGKAIAMEDDWYCESPNSTAYSCPDGSLPQKRVTANGWEPYCQSNGQVTPAIQKSSSAPSPQTADTSGPSRASDPAPVSPQVENASATQTVSSQDTTSRTAEETTSPQNQTEEAPSVSRSQVGALPFQPEAYDIQKSQAADDPWGLIQKLRQQCPINVLDKAACDARTKERDQSCIIAGVKSSYGSKYCKPVRKLCFDEQGATLINEACKGRSGFECGPGQTVCNPLLGFRDSTDKLGPKDKSRGAFCAPVGGRGAKSATAVCAEWNNKYEVTKLGRSNVRDVLAMGNAQNMQILWENLRKNVNELCDDGSVAKRNCEACQVMKLRLAILTKDVTGSRQCREPSEIQRMQQPTREDFERATRQDDFAI